MSLLVKYTSGSTYALSCNTVSNPVVQGIAIDHIGGTDQSNTRALGLEWGTATVEGDILDKTACSWDDIVAISQDAGTTYQACRSNGATFTYDQWSGIYRYSLSLSVAPLRYGSTHDATAIWGWNTITVPSATGSGLIRVSYQGPTRYWPLQSSLASVDGVGLTFSRAAAEVYKDINYSAGTPIYDGGLILDGVNLASASITAKSLVMRVKTYHTGGNATLQYLWQSAHNTCSVNITTGVVSWTDGTTTITATLPNLAAFTAGGTLDVAALDDTTDTLVLIQSGYTTATGTNTLAALVWGTLNIGSNGSTNQLYAAVSHIVAYPYVLIAAEYGALHLTIAPLTWVNHSIAYRSIGTIYIDSNGRLIDAAGADITACMAGVVPTAVATLAMSDGLSARWLVSIDDTWRV